VGVGGVVGLVTGLEGASPPPQEASASDISAAAAANKPERKFINPLPASDFILPPFRLLGSASLNRNTLQYKQVHDVGGAVFNCSTCPNMLGLFSRIFLFDINRVITVSISAEEKTIHSKNAQNEP
jgi:hypothetical protein